ncbi:hypothetical protein BP354E_0116 [Burkholderia pseudomallei 354e]|nr:hypothetical protein BP354A_6296 [Burkholderia pseudomallei 354a]EIF78354.1 hypothetical protein BP354E_0116 [Burkholderia pseudomallei 354e]
MNPWHVTDQIVLWNKEGSRKHIRLSFAIQVPRRRVPMHQQMPKLVSRIESRTLSRFERVQKNIGDVILPT